MVGLKVRDAMVGLKRPTPLVNHSTGSFPQPHPLFCSFDRFFLRVEYIHVNSSGPQPEQVGRDGGGGDDNSREEVSPPIAGTSGMEAEGGPAVTAEQCREGTDAASFVGRAETEEPLRWWLEVVGAGEVTLINLRGRLVCYNDSLLCARRRQSRTMPLRVVACHYSAVEKVFSGPTGSSRRGSMPLQCGTVR